MRPTRKLAAEPPSSIQARSTSIDGCSSPPRKPWFDPSRETSGAAVRPLLSPHRTSSSAPTCTVRRARSP
jgi:hypothetical protein